MFVEYGRLKMFLVTVQGLLVPFSTPLADNLPHWMRFAGACLQGGAMALFAYLLKPASSLKPEDLADLMGTETENKELAPKKPGDRG